METWPARTGPSSCSRPALLGRTAPGASASALGPRVFEWKPRLPPREGEEGAAHAHSPGPRHFTCGLRRASESADRCCFRRLTTQRDLKRTTSPKHISGLADTGAGAEVEVGGRGGEAA